MVSGKPSQKQEEGMKAKIVFEALLMTFVNAPASGGFAVRWKGHLHFKLKFLVVT